MIAKRRICLLRALSLQLTPYQARAGQCDAAPEAACVCVSKHTRSQHKVLRHAVLRVVQAGTNIRTFT
jgi:hypothetical protein